MINGNFYTPDTIKPLYDQIVPAYQIAFAGEPWNEVSKCIDERSRCVGGLSAVAVGNLCGTCGLRPSRQAYEADELIETFDSLGATRPTAWYAEQNETGLTMAAIAWRATPATIAEEKYADVPEISDWMIERLGDQPIMWLDEVFANRQRRPFGNLKNFGSFVVGLAKMIECDIVAYRTIEPRMTAVALRDFDDNATVFTREVGVPDRREFVIADTRGGVR